MGLDAYVKTEGGVLIPKWPQPIIDNTKEEISHLVEKNAKLDGELQQQCDAVTKKLYITINGDTRDCLKNVSGIDKIISLLKEYKQGGDFPHHSLSSDQSIRNANLSILVGRTLAENFEDFIYSLPGVEGFHEFLLKEYGIDRFSQYMPQGEILPDTTNESTRSFYRNSSPSSSRIMVILNRVSNIREILKEIQEIS